MEKTIVIDGKNIKLKTNGLVPLIYKKELGRDFFDDIQKLIKAENDIEVLYCLTWVYARAADENISDFKSWFESFKAFPVNKYISDILELTTACLSTGEKQSSKKKKKAEEQR